MKIRCDASVGFGLVSTLLVVALAWGLAWRTPIMRASRLAAPTSQVSELFGRCDYIVVARSELHPELNRDFVADAVNELPGVVQLFIPGVLLPLNRKTFDVLKVNPIAEGCAGPPRLVDSPATDTLYLRALNGG